MRFLLSVLLLSCLAGVQLLGQQLPLGKTQALVARTDGRTLLLDSSYLHPTELPVFSGEGLTFDATNNLFISGGSGLRIYNASYQFLGAATIADPQIAPSDLRPYSVALRNATQAIACNADFNNPARLFVFDITNLNSPFLSLIVALPNTLSCRGVAFDSEGYLWVATYYQLNKLTLESQGIPVAEQHWYPGANPFVIAFQPGGDKIVFTEFGANLVGIANKTDPSLRLATLVNVCDQSTWSPEGVAFDSDGNLFIGCANFDDASTTDIVSIASGTFASLSGTVDVNDIPNVKIALPGGRFLNETPFLAFRNQIKAPKK